jgi:pimeloyl-ACP methyl ester carboxylesterase
VGVTTTLEAWRRDGEKIIVPIRNAERQVFVRRVGHGAPVVLLHGFPASSFEWAAVEYELAHRHEVVSFDFLGYGASDKPVGHRYTIFEQADLAETVIARYAPSGASVVAYDYGAIVATELLARQAPTAAAFRRFVFLNAGLYADLYRPRLAQRASLVPVVGAALALMFTEKMFIKTWGEVFSAEHPLDPHVAALHYRAFRENDPARSIQRKLLRYIPERAANTDRFERALASTDIPLSFLWGMQDPVSGSAIAEELRNRIPGVDLIEYADAGHCPHIEIPDRVAADIAARVGP